MSAKPILYSFHTSSASWRVRIALAIKNISYEYKAVNLKAPGGGEQLTDEYKAINPTQQVHTYSHQAVPLPHSTVKLKYCEPP